jgi:hypothetical protein
LLWPHHLFVRPLSGISGTGTPSGEINLVEVTSFNYRIVNNDQISNQPMIDIRVEKVFAGTMLPGQRFTLPLQDGANCRDWEGKLPGGRLLHPNFG